MNNRIKNKSGEDAFVTPPPPPAAESEDKVTRVLIKVSVVPQPSKFRKNLALFFTVFIALIIVLAAVVALILK